MKEKKIYLIGQGTTKNNSIGGQHPVLLLVDKSIHKNSHFHHHDYLELFYVINGNGVIKTPCKTCEFKSGQVLIINAKAEHSILHEKNKNLVYYSMSITNINLKGLNENSISNDEFTVINEKKSEVIFKYITNIINEYDKKQAGYMLYAEGLLFEMFVLLCRFCKYNYDNQLQANALAEKTKAFLEKNYNQTLTLEDIAKSLYANKFHVIHSFKKAFNLSPLQYLTIIKMNKAKELLINTTLSISEIAQKVGYDNPVYFAELFKQKIGTTPSSFRKITNK